MNKTTTTTILLSALLLHSCQVFDAIAPADPIASFSVDVQDYGHVLVIDNSKNAEELIIDWGDGQTSNTSAGRSIDHDYEANQEYEITVTSISKNAKKSDKLQKTVNVNTLHGNGILYTYTNFKTAVDIYIDDKFVGTVTKYITDKSFEPSCGTAPFITIDRPIGKYRVYAKVPSLVEYIYNGDIVIDNASCSRFELK